MTQNKIFILNTTKSDFSIATNGKLGTIKLKAYEAIPITENMADLKLQNALDRTLKKVILCREVPKKYIQLYNAIQNANLTDINNAKPDLKGQD